MKRQWDTDYLTRKAADVRAPVEGDIRAVDVTTTSAATAIETVFFDHYVSFYADGGDVYVVFGDSGVVAAPAARTGDTRCIPIAQGTVSEWFIPQNDGSTHFAAISATGTLVLRYWRSSH